MSVLARTVNPRTGKLTPFGVEQMQSLADRSEWVSYPADIPFYNRGKLTGTALVWLTQVADRGGFPRPATTSGGLDALLAQYGVVG